MLAGGISSSDNPNKLWFDPDGIHEPTENPIGHSPDIEFEPSEFVHTLDLELMPHRKAERPLRLTRHLRDARRNGKHPNRVSNARSSCPPAALHRVPANGRAFSGEPSEQSERPERKRGRRVRCNAMFGRLPNFAAAGEPAIP
jgi:hypothetical protein